MLETMLGYIVDDCGNVDEKAVILPSMTVNHDSKTPYTDATQVSPAPHKSRVLHSEVLLGKIPLMFRLSETL